MSGSADVVIVGGGVTGASTACHLASLGVRHVVRARSRRVRWDCFATGGTPTTFMVSYLR